VQYPVATGVRLRTELLEFVDGAEQRFPSTGELLKRWVLQYSQLDEGEMRNLRTFVESALESGSLFPFIDPSTSVVYANCRINKAEFDESWGGDGQGSTRIEIVEVRV
jgi:hypothetical protein